MNGVSAAIQEALINVLKVRPDDSGQRALRTPSGRSCNKITVAK